MASRPPYSMLPEKPPGSDPSRVIGKLYAEGRRYPYGKSPEPAPELTPEFKPPTPPGHDYEHASYGLGDTTPVSHPPDESGPQFEIAKVATHNDTQEAWCRGMSERTPQHPHFDHGPSGYRYSTKIRR